MNRFSIRQRGLMFIVGLLVVTAASLNISRFEAALVKTYSASFTEAAGLRAGDDVRVSGVRVGQVNEVGFDGDHVRVEFTSERKVGTSSHAAIRTATLLGARYLQLVPRGAGNLSSDQSIPLSRTTVPYTSTTALGDLTDTSAAIDTEKLAESLGLLTETFQDTPQVVTEVLEGTARLSQTIAARDADLKRMFDSANGVSAVLAERNGDVVTILKKGNLLLNALEDRRKSLRQLMKALRALSVQISGVVADNRRQLGPALDGLHQTLTVVNRHIADLDKVITGLGGFIGGIGEGVGSGPFFQGFVAGISPVSLRPSLDELFQTAGGQ